MRSAYTDSYNLTVKGVDMRHSYGRHLLLRGRYGLLLLLLLVKIVFLLPLLLLGRRLVGRVVSSYRGCI